MRKMVILAVFIALCLVLVISVDTALAFDPPVQGTGNATDVILWHGDNITATVSLPDIDFTTILLPTYTLFNKVLSLILAGCGLIFFTAVALKTHHALPFQLAAGSSMMLGLYWYDVYTTDIGLTMSLMLIVYSIACFAFSYGCLFWTKEKEE